jgi:hypothetical protein
MRVKTLKPSNRHTRSTLLRQKLPPAVWERSGLHLHTSSLGLLTHITGIRQREGRRGLYDNVYTCHILKLHACETAGF